MTSTVLVVNPFLYHYRRGVFRELDRLPGIDVTFASDVVGVDGIAVMSPSEISRHLPMRSRRLGHFKWQRGLIAHLLRTKYDAVIFLGDASFASTWVGAVVGRLKGSRVLFWTIGWHRPEAGVKRLVRMAFYRLAHVLLLYGELGREIGAQLGYPESRMKVIGNSIEAPPTDPSVGEIQLPERGDALWIGAVIRLNPVKHLSLVLEAAALLRAEGMDVRVLFVGEGPARESLLDAASDNDVPLYLAGPVYDRTNLARVYELLDITVVPSAIGLTVIQSLGFGVPAISDDDRYAQMPEWEAIVPGVTGEVYVAGSARSLADAIARQDERLSTRIVEISEACRSEVALRWSPSLHASRIAQELLRGEA